MISISVILIFVGLIISVVAAILLLQQKRSDKSYQAYDAQFEYKSNYSATRLRMKSPYTHQTVTLVE